MAGTHKKIANSPENLEKFVSVLQAHPSVCCEIIVNLGGFEIEEMKVLSKNLLELFQSVSLCDAVLSFDGINTTDTLLAQYAEPRSCKNVGDFLRLYCKSGALAGFLLRMEVFEQLIAYNLHSEFQVQSDSQNTLHEIIICDDRADNSAVDRFLEENADELLRLF